MAARNKFCSQSNVQFTEFVPILSEAMKEIIDVSETRDSPTKKSAHSIAHPQDHSQFSSYVTIALSPCEPITSCTEKVCL